MSKSQSKTAFGTAQNELGTVQGTGSNLNNQQQGFLSGYSQNANQLFPGIASGYSDLAGSSVSYDPNVLNQLNTGFGNLATTGGISPEQMASYQDQASKAAQSAYSSGQSALERQISATGGYGLSTAALNSMSRGAANAASSAAQGEIASLAPTIQQGQIAGLGGLNTVQQGSTGTQLASKGVNLSALGGLGNLYSTNVGATQNTLQQILQNFQTTGQLSNQDIQMLAGIGSEPGFGTNLINAIGTLGGAATGVMGGIGKMSGGGAQG